MPPPLAHCRCRLWGASTASTTRLLDRRDGFVADRPRLRMTTLPRATAAASERPKVLLTDSKRLSQSSSLIPSLPSTIVIR